jgi:hypothetical protein
MPRRSASSGCRLASRAVSTRRSRSNSQSRPSCSCQVPRSEPRPAAARADARARRRPPPPSPLRPGRRPPQQLFRLGRAGLDPHLAQWAFIRANRHRGVQALVRVDPDHHCRHRRTPHRHRRTVGSHGGHALLQCWRSRPLSSQTAARPDRLAPRSKARPITGRQAVREPSPSGLSTLRPGHCHPARSATPTRSLNKAGRRAGARSRADHGR